jgi:hypothetical protein
MDSEIGLPGKGARKSGASSRSARRKWRWVITEAIFGAGEIDPEFGGDQIIIAYAENGRSLGQDGFAKIIAPGDKAGGRFVSNIVKIEVRDVGLPQYTH